MRRIGTSAVCAALAIVVSGAFPPPVRAQAESKTREWMYRQYLRLHEYVHGGEVDPHWLGDGRRFWYVDRGSDELPVFLVDPPRRTRRRLFDLAPVRRRFLDVFGEDVSLDELPLRELQPARGEGEPHRLKLGDHEVWLGTLTEEMRVLPAGATAALAPLPAEVVSPDGAWAAWIEAENVWLRSLRDGTRAQLTRDGTAARPWGGAVGRGPNILWSPDGSKLAVVRLDKREVRKIPIVSYTTELPEVEWADLWYADGSRETTGLFILEVSTGQRLGIEAGGATGSTDRIHPLAWRPDASELLYARVSVDRREIRVAAADAETGRVRPLFSERTGTFFYFTSWDPLTLMPLRETDRFVWKSHRDDRGHLYLYDLDGNLIRRLTRGGAEVFRVLEVDEEAGWVYFSAHSDPEHPYDIHLCRASLDGGDIHQLTEGRGIHDAVLSPAAGFFVDTYRNVDLLPITELRTTDGELLDTLSVATIEAPEGFRWTAPEEFVVKAADGETDLHGVLYKPFDFDPARRYPVVELMSGRPDVAVNFILRSHSLGGAALAQLGFVVVALDGRGTPMRGRAFHDVVHGSLGRVEITEHVAALSQLFDERPYLDRNRVGVTGYSFGGYYTIRAILQAPDVYDVALAGAPYDPRGDAVLPYLGPPSENPEGYEYASNLWLADRLQGHLLIYHGSSDLGAYFFFTMQLVDAFIQAGKQVDLLIFPDAGHDLGPERSAYAREARRRYLQEHLQGLVEGLPAGQ